MIRALVDARFTYKLPNGSITYTRCESPRRFHSISHVAALSMLGPKYDIVLTSRKYGKYLPWVFPPPSSRSTKLVTYQFIFARRGNRLRKHLSYMIWSRAIRRFDRAFVQARSDIDVYSSLFRISREKFAYVPIGSPLAGKDYVGPIESGYILSAGRSGRDYRVLLDALKGLSIPTVIVGSSNNELPASDLPPWITLRMDISKSEYLELLRNAKIVVVPLLAEWGVSSGQVVAVEAMSMGKPLIITDVPWVRDYIHRACLLVAPGDSRALSAAVADLYHGSFDRLVDMGRAGYEHAAEHLTMRRFQERFESELARTLDWR